MSTFWAIVFILGFLFVLLFIIIAVIDLGIPKFLPLRPACNTDSDCSDDQVCEVGNCRIPIGGPCTVISECVSQAVACDGTCVDQPLNGLGQPCPCSFSYLCTGGFCKALLGSTCVYDSDCSLGLCIGGICSLGMTGMTGMTVSPALPCPSSSSSYSSLSTPTSSGESYGFIDPCITSQDCPPGYFCAPRSVSRGYSNGKMLPLLSRKYLHGENALDVTVHQGSIYLLLEGGDILRITDHAPIKFTGQVIMEKIFSFGDFYGISMGHLYIATIDESLSWRLIRDIPSGILGASVTLNNKYLWLETENRGYIYNNSLKRVREVGSSFKKRVYGWDLKVYIDHYPDKIITEDGKVISNVKTAAYFPDGELISYDQGDIYFVKVCYYQGDYVPFFILERGCIL